MASRISAQRIPSQRTRLAVIASLGLLCLLLTPVSSLAKEDRDRDQEQLTLPIGGSAGTAKFTGNLTIQRFVQVNGQVKAVGVIKGMLSDASGVPLGTALRGPLLLPVTVGAATTPVAAMTQPESRQSSTADSSPGAAVKRPVLLLLTVPPAPPQSTCQAVAISVGAVNLNVAGLTVTTMPVDLTLGGQTGGSNALGTLLCNVLSTLTNVANLVNLLNQVLGLLGGL